MGEITIPAGGWWWSDADGYAVPERSATASAERLLEGIYRQALVVEDPRERARELASLERLLTDPAVGMLRRIREARTEAILARIAAGDSLVAIAASEGVTVRRVRQLIEQRAVATPDQARSAHRAAMQARRRQGDERRAVRVAEAQAWRRRLDSGEVTRAELEAEVGLSSRQVRDRLREARLESAVSGLAPGAVGRERRWGSEGRGLGARLVDVIDTSGGIDGASVTRPEDQVAATGEEAVPPAE